MHSRYFVTLNLHGLGSPPGTVDPADAPFWLTREAFTQVLDFIRGVPHVKVTFDDGNSSDFEIALPELIKRGLRAEFFLLADKIGQPGFLTAPQVRAMVAEGMRIGSHGAAHVAWPSCDETELEREVVQARTRLETIAGQAISTAACPFGKYNRRSLTALHDAGYETVYTSDGGVAVRDSWLQRRNTIRKTDTPAQVVRLVQTSPSSPRLYAGRLRTFLKSLR